METKLQMIQGVDAREEYVEDALEVFNKLTILEKDYIEELQREMEEQNILVLHDFINDKPLILDYRAEKYGIYN